MSSVRDRLLACHSRLGECSALLNRWNPTYNEPLDNEDDAEYWGPEVDLKTWNWLSKEKKLGVGDFMRKRRFDDARLYLAFIESVFHYFEDILHLIVFRRAFGFGLYESIRTMSIDDLIRESICLHVNVYHSLDTEEFHAMPVAACQNPMRIIAELAAVCRGNFSFSRSRKNKNFEPVSVESSWFLISSQFYDILDVHRSKSTRFIRDHCYKVCVEGLEEILLCAAAYRGRVRRETLSVLVVVMYVFIKTVLRTRREVAKQRVQFILEATTPAFREQLASSILSYRKFGFFLTCGQTERHCLDDSVLKICWDLLQGAPECMWNEMFKPLIVKFDSIKKPQVEHRRLPELPIQKPDRLISLNFLTFPSDRDHYIRDDRSLNPYNRPDMF